MNKNAQQTCGPEFWIKEAKMDSDSARGFIVGALEN